MEYTKPPRSLDDQITLLSERGLVIADYAIEPATKIQGEKITSVWWDEWGTPPKLP